MPTYDFDGDYISATVDVDNPAAPFDLVEERFTQTINKANEVLEMLIGSDGSGGLIGEMDAALATAPSTAITAEDVDTSLVLDSSGLPVPTFDDSSMVAIPSVTVDFSVARDFPDDIALAMSWSEATLPADVYNALKTQILADLVDGSTGITDTVETAIYTRARNRQQVANLAEYAKVNNTIANLQQALPSGVSVALLADFGIGQARQEADLEYGITEQQARLAQENRKSAIQGAISLDQLLRQTRDGESNRNYQSAKDLLAFTLQDYSERMKAVQIFWEGKKIEAEAKAINVQAAIDTDKGLIDIYKAETDAFEAAETAISSRNSSAVKLIEAKIAAADLDLRAQIAEASALVQAYTAEMSINERISSDRAQIAAQVAASLLSAVHAGASIGYSGSESSSKGYHVSVSGSESHSAEHDPAS